MRSTRRLFGKPQSFTGRVTGSVWGIHAACRKYVCLPLFSSKLKTLVVRLLAAVWEHCPRLGMALGQIVRVLWRGFPGA
jgi:hypothetical protein